VAKDAQKTEAHLKNANLLLSRQAEVDTKPQLEIHADDVKCSHGASVGQIDSNALFYLRSRGIAEDEARRMLCVGFAGEIIERCGPAELREYIEGRVGARLG
jgi:Fe-S cluster assembly protein SufD